MEAVMPTYLLDRIQELGPFVRRIVACQSLPLTLSHLVLCQQERIETDPQTSLRYRLIGFGSGFDWRSRW